MKTDFQKQALTPSWDSCKVSLLYNFAYHNRFPPESQGEKVKSTGKSLSHFRPSLFRQNPTNFFLFRQKTSKIIEYTYYVEGN